MPYSSDNDYYDHHHQSRHSSPFPTPAGLPPSARVNPAYSVEEVFVRNGKQDSHHLRAHAYRDGIERHRGRSLSSSAPRRIDQERHHRHASVSDSDDLSPRSSPHPSHRRRRRTMIPYNPPHPPPPSRTHSRTPSPSPSPSPPHHRTPLLPLALATITTAAAVNNIYQSHKASRARRAHLRTGEMTEHEARSLENQAAVLDLISVGVAAVGVHNAVGGWRRVRAG